MISRQRIWPMSVFGRRNQRGRIRPLNGATDVTIDFSKLSVGPYVTFTRAATSGTGQTGATYIDSAGQFQLAGANVARFHHSTAGSFLGLLSEEQRANILIRSNLVSGATIPTGWTRPFGAVDPVAASSNHGTADGAIAWTFTAAGGADRPMLSSTAMSNTTDEWYMASLVVESVNTTIQNQEVLVLNAGGLTVFGTKTYYRDGVAVGATDPVTTGILSVKQQATTGGSTMNLRIGLGCGSVGLTGVCKVSRPQVEVCSATCRGATSYIPTAGVAVTRPADYASLDMALPSVNATVGKLQGTVVVRYQRGTHGTDNRVPLSVSDGAHSNMTIGEHATASATHSIVNGYETLDRTTGIAGLNKAAFSYGTPSLSAYALSYSLNGSAAVTGNTDMDMNALTVVPIGRDGSSTVGGSDWLNGGVRDIVFYPDRKTDAQLILL